MPHWYSARMHSGDLSREQAEKLHDRIAPLATYLYELQTRMDERDLSSSRQRLLVRYGLLRSALHNINRLHRPADVHTSRNVGRAAIDCPLETTLSRTRGAAYGATCLRHRTRVGPANQTSPILARLTETQWLGLESGDEQGTVELARAAGVLGVTVDWLVFGNAV